MYLDLLERLMGSEKMFDVDVLLVYDEKDSLKMLANAVKSLSENGKSVRAARKNDGSIKYRQLAVLKNGEAEVIETND